MSLPSLRTMLTKESNIAPETLKKYKTLKPVQDKLDAEERHITVIVYHSQRTPATFKCDICEHIWEVKQARYVLQQKRGCSNCAPSLMSKRAKQRVISNDGK